MTWNAPKTYAVKHIDEQVIAESRSGGIFTAISDYVLKQGGVVYGCILTEDHLAVHARAEVEQERNLMRGSKYIQSNLGETYKLVKNDLQVGKMVLFSGTSCQVAGLRAFLGHTYENLICIDILCHGVPSPKVWKKYLQWQEKRRKGKVVKISFRNKNMFGWRDHTETIYFDNGKVIHSKTFKNLFLGNHILRPSCYECPYKMVTHPGDITIADYWGIEKAAPELDDNKGVSLVLINNDFGEEVFASVEPYIISRVTKLEDSIQPALKSPSRRPGNREKFWHDFSTKDFTYIARKYGDTGTVNDIKHFLKKVKKRYLKYGRRTISYFIS